MTNQKQIRAAFWEAHPTANRKKYPARNTGENLRGNAYGVNCFDSVHFADCYCNLHDFFL